MGTSVLQVYANEHFNRGLAALDKKLFDHGSENLWNVYQNLNCCVVIFSIVLNKYYYQDTMVISIFCQSFYSIYSSVDESDFRIFEPTPFSPKCHSHKFVGPGLRYEI